MNNPNILDKLFKLFTDDVIDVKKEICYIVSNLGYSGDPETIYKLHKSYESVAHFLNMLQEKDPKAIEISLECLFKVLDVGEKMKTLHKLPANPLVEDVKAGGGIEILEGLQHHESEVVYANVVKILTQYF